MARHREFTDDPYEKTGQYLSYHSNDVSTLKELGGRWYPNVEGYKNKAPIEQWMTLEKVLKNSNTLKNTF